MKLPKMKMQMTTAIMKRETDVADRRISEEISVKKKRRFTAKTIKTGDEVKEEKVNKPVVASVVNPIALQLLKSGYNFPRHK